MSTLADDTAPDRDEQAVLWCLSLADGELPAHERAAFDRWINEPANASAFEDAARAWNAAEGAAESAELIHMRTAALENYRRTNQRRWRRGLSARWYWAGAIAASLMIAVLATALLYHPAQIYRTGVGERRIAVLDDGSKLSLDADTEVAVRLSRDRREMTLARGRAKFDVAHDPLRPFTVTAANRMVVATGTSFSVEMLDRRVHVLLYEGRVAVLDTREERSTPRQVDPRTAGGASQALTPGKELVAQIDTPNPPTISASDPTHSLSWEVGQLTFDDERLSSAVERVNRYSAEKLVIGDEATAGMRINGVFTAGDVNAFLEGVTTLNPVRVVREPGQLTLRRD